MVDIELLYQSLSDTDKEKLKKLVEEGEKPLVGFIKFYLDKEFTKLKAFPNYGDGSPLVREFTNIEEIYPLLLEMNFKDTVIVQILGYNFPSGLLLTFFKEMYNYGFRLSEDIFDFMRTSDLTFTLKKKDGWYVNQEDNDE